jgi:membrane protease YdiL (CAAX protease family)
MIVPVARVCHACGVRTTSDARDCPACGTRLPAMAIAPAVAPPGLVASLAAAPLVDPAADIVTPPPEVQAPLTSGALRPHRLVEPPPLAFDAGEHAWRRVRGAAWLFFAFIGLTVASFVAIKAGAPEAYVEVAGDATLAAMTALLLAVAYGDLRPLLATGGGIRGALAAVLGLAVIIAGGAVYFSIARALGLPMVRLSDSLDAVHWPSWTAYALSAVAPGVLEELAFRGYLMDRLDRLLTPKETLLVQAALFAVVHFGVVIFPSHFGIGLVLGTIRRRSRSLYPGMVTHAGWNALVIWCEQAGLDFP